jgi:hypothetical protein
MGINGLLTDVRWEWTGTEVTADLLTGETVLPVLDPESITVGEFVWVAGTGPLEITEVDVDAATFTIEPGLSIDVDRGTEVARDIGGQPGRAWVCEVILADAEKPVEVPLTIHDLAVMPEGTYDPPVVIILSDDLERVENLPGSQPIIPGSYVTDLPDGPAGESAYDVAVANGFIGTEEEWLASLEGDPGSPGDPGDPGDPGLSAYEVAVANGFVGTEAEWLASLEGEEGPPGEPPPDVQPAASPTPTVESGPSCAIIRFPYLLDAQTYDLYHTYVNTDAKDATTLLMENVTSPVWIYYDKNRVPLSLEADSYFAIVARNGVEDAAPSPWVAGRPGQVQPDYQTQLMGDVIATRLSGQTVEGATLKGGVLDILGALYATNGFLDITANQMQALAAVFKDNVSVQGTKNKLAGDLEIGTGVTAPTSKASVSAGPWTTKTMPSAIKRCWQMCDTPDGTSHLAVTNLETGSSNSTVYIIRKSDAVVQGSFLLGSTPTSTKTPVSMCRIGNTLYVLITDAVDATDANSYWIYSYDISGSLTGTKARASSGRLFGSQVNRVALGVYNGELITAWINASKQQRHKTWNPSTFAQTSDNTSAFTYGAREDVLAVFQQGTGNVSVWVNGYMPGAYNLAMSTAATEETFPLPSGTFYGLYFDGTRMHAITTTKIYSGSKHPGGSYDYQWTQVDNDTTAGSTTAESTPSAILTSSAVPRWQFPIITTPPPDDDGTTNGANTVGVYAAPTGFAGGPRKQVMSPAPAAPASYAENTRAFSFDEILTSGVVPPTINGFLDSAHVATNQPGRLWSLPTDAGGKQLIEVKGDGLAPRFRNLRMIRPQIRRRRDATQTYAVTTWEAHSYNTAIERSEGITVTSSNTYTIVRPGEYEVYVHTTWDCTAALRRVVDAIVINGTRVARAEGNTPAAGAHTGVGFAQTIKRTYSLVAGDTIQAHGWQSGGSGATTVNTLGDTGGEAQTFIEITYVGETT